MKNIRRKYTASNYQVPQQKSAKGSLKIKIMQLFLLVEKPFRL